MGMAWRTDGAWTTERGRGAAAAWRPKRRAACALSLGQAWTLGQTLACSTAASWMCDLLNPLAVLPSALRRNYLFLLVLILPTSARCFVTDEMHFVASTWAAGRATADMEGSAMVSPTMFPARAATASSTFQPIAADNSGPWALGPARGAVTDTEATMTDDWWLGRGEATATYALSTDVA